MTKPLNDEARLQYRVDTGLRIPSQNIDGICYVTFTTCKGPRQGVAEAIRRWRRKYKIRGFGYSPQEYGIKIKSRTPMDPDFEENTF